MAAGETTGKVNYQDLKDWIARQEAHEVSTGKPAPLTAAQRKAIAELSRAAQAPKPGMVNVTVGDEDYVSVLNYFCQCNPGVTKTYTDGHIPSIPTPLYTSTLNLDFAHLDKSPVTFPSATTCGLIDGSPPCFSRKKDAQKYAAQQCVEWLVSQNYLVPSESGPHGYAVPKAAYRNGAPGAESVSAPQKVEQLCRQLNIAVPRYEMQQLDGVGGSLWSGELDWGRDQGLVPEGSGKVDKARGRNACREQMAMEAVAVLQRIEREREAQLAMVMGD